MVKLKKRPDELKGELTPSLEVCVRHYLGEPTPFPLANPFYFFENTLLRGPLEFFVRNVTEGLTRNGPTVLPLRIGFGFGKTHAQILLLHAFLGSDRLPPEAKDTLREVGWDESLAQKVLVLPLDFFNLEPPFPRLAEVVRAYADGGTSFHRSSQIAEKVGEHSSALLSGFLESDKFADIIANIASETKSCLLVMIDELGYGFVKRAQRYLEAKEHGKPLEEELLNQAVWLASFLTSLSELSNRQGIPLIVVYAWAEQDAETLRLFAAKDETISNVLETVRLYLDERLGRYTGGIGEGALGFSLEDMVDIAIFRVLDVPKGAGEEPSERLGDGAVAHGALTPGEKGAFVRSLRKHYPLSPFLVSALKKFARREELPGAEHVRSAIYALALAAERALSQDPNSPLIDVKHMSLEEACFLGHMGDLRQDWASVLAEVSEAIDNADPRMKGLCEHIAKHILAKAATANVFEIERAQDISGASKYGTTSGDIALSLICTTPLEKVGEVLSSSREALEHLISRSGRIEERIIDGERYLFPAVLGTVFSRLRYFLADERKMATEDRLGYLMRSSLLSEVLGNVGIEGCTIYRIGFELLEDPHELRNRIEKSISEPHPAFVIVEPWDTLFAKQLQERRSFVSLASHIVDKMNRTEYVEALGRPFYLIALLPNLEESVVEELVQPLIEYEAAKKFMGYLEREEDVRREMMERALSSAAVKRVRLSRRDVRRIIEQKARLEIEAAAGATHSIMTRAARDTAVKFLNLYSQYIVYDLSNRAFVLQDLSKQISQGTIGEIEDPSKAADAIGTFFNVIVNSRYVRDIEKLEDVVSKDIEERVNRGMFEPLKVSELTESLIQGAYELIPLSGTLARTAVERMDGTSFELDDKKVTVLVEDDTISFEVTKKPEEIPVGPTPVGITEESRRPTIYEEVKLVKNFSLLNLSRDEMSSLAQLIREQEQIKVNAVTVKIDGEKVKGTLDVKEDFKSITAVFNAISAIAGRYGAELNVSVSLKESIKEEELRDILGDLAEKMET